jgi:hypothetical protein
MSLASLKIIITKIYRLAYDKLTSVFDIVLLNLNWPVNKLKSLNNTEKKIIVYIGGGLVPRISRIAKWVKRNEGFETVLVAHKISYQNKFSNNEWSYVFLYRNEFHLKRIIRQIHNVYIYHGFAPGSKFPDIVRDIVKTPFIIDFQDVYACYYGLNPDIRWLKFELPHEKNCLLLSNGIVAHSMESNVAIRKYSKDKPPAIFFPLYCDNDFFKNNTKQLSEDHIHLVYAGGVAGSHRNKTHYGSIQFHNLIKILSEQKIHFHIYPSPSIHSTDKTEYEQIAVNNIYFHFHKSVSQENLAYELNKYHFGILPFFLEDTQQSSEKYKYATTLKLFNYIEAGIPIIVSQDLVYQSWIVERYKAGLTITKNDLVRLKNIVTAIDYQAMVNTMIANRENISLKTHIPRLIQFYKQIAGE